MDDVEHMGRAIQLAASVRSATTPNPWVGAVLVTADGSTVVGEGATAPPGGAHAEVTALRQAGEAARGATLYTTLEPCSHHGRTPPCIEAIIDAGVVRVVVGVEDPDPQVAGRGLAALGGRPRRRDPGRGRGRGIRPTGALPQAPHDWSALGRPENGGQPGRPHRGTRRDQPLDHRRGGPARRPSPAGRVRRRAGRGGNGPSRRPRADRSSGGRRRARTAPPGGAGPCARGRPGPPGPRALGRSRPGLGRARAAAGCSRCSWRGAPGWPMISTPPAWSTATCCTWLRSSSGATTPDRSFPVRELAQLTTYGRAGWFRWSAWVTIFEWR